MSSTLLKYLLYKKMATKKETPLLAKIIAIAILIPVTAIIVIFLAGVAMSLFNFFFVV